MFKRIYKLASDIFSLKAPSYLEKRAERGKEEPIRIGERYGIASHERPNGVLLWIHAASVGEARSALALINSVSENHVNWHILITTGTVSSARIISAELPSNAFHQYLPLDVSSWVKSFLDHWQPNAVVWMEQEIWPNMLGEIHQRAIPAILANGRLTESSYKRWTWLKPMAKSLLVPFRNIYAQSEYDGERYEKLSGKKVLIKGNLKYAAEPLPYKPIAFDTLAKEINGRPIWLAASTHLGEEFVIAKTHKLVLERYPDALLVIIPRHPDRGEQIINDLNESGLTIACRSFKDPISPDTQAYLADTFSELGLFYRLCNIVFVGGSLMPIGGHNLIEPAQLNCAISYGPHMDNFLEIKELFEKYKLSQTILNEDELAAFILNLMDNPKQINDRAIHTATLIANEAKVLQNLIVDVETMVNESDASRQQNA